MFVSTMVYKNLISSKGGKRSFLKLLRLFMVKYLNDPLCSLSVHGHMLEMPMSHLIPLYLDVHEYYDRLPKRLSNFVTNKYGHLNCIDVGANIGDTIAAFYTDENNIFLAIEANPKFYKILESNWGSKANVSLVAALCSSHNDNGIFAVNEDKGTAIISQEENGISMSIRTLDSIVKDHPASANFNVLKIDTDGYDFEVISGSLGIIKENLPAIFFECSPFENDNYVEDCLHSLNLFKDIGYNNFILYDHLGYLLGLYQIDQLSHFNNLIFYQIASDACYFDILIMRDEDIFDFYRGEKANFVSNFKNESLQNAIKAAAAIC